MKVNLDENGYVREWALVGDNGGIDVPEPEDLEEFIVCAAGYKVVDGVLMKDTEKDRHERTELQKNRLRERRKLECFSFINRGQLWYATLSVKQLAELTAWYTAWLRVTDTMQIPERPDWLEDE